MNRWIGKLHNDERGAISVLVLLTIWCFVALIAMLWNVSELSVRRQQVQAAADSAAHTAALWMSRSTNEINVQNMLIAQDGSAEVIWRATVPTQAAIDARLLWELARLQAFLDQQRQLRNGLPGFINAINHQYSLLQSALQLVQADYDNGTLSFPDPKSKTAYAIKLRQAIYAANWVQTVFVPQLQALVDQVMNDKLTAQMIAQAQDYIAKEQAIMTAMETHTQPGTSQDVPTLMLTDQQAIFAAEKGLVAAVPATVASATTDSSGGTTSLSDFYHTDITLATMTNTSGASAPIAPPVKGADEVESDGDSGSDPINPNTGPASILYSPPPGTNPLGVNYNPFNTKYGGWGHCWSFPIERYLSARVSIDMQGLQSDYLQPIDTLRMQLAQLWAQELGITLNVPQLPKQIQDPQLDPLTNQNDQIPILPVLTPTGASGDKTDADFSYERAQQQYLAAIQRLISVLKNYGGLWTIFTEPYAVPQWQGQIREARELVLQELGNEKCFMVLQTYKLYPIPQWAQSGLEASLTQAVSWQIFVRNRQLQQMGVGPAFAYLQQDGGVPYIVNEMLSRPWPYEMTPPDQQVPPTRGMGKIDRQNYFTIMAAAKSQDATTPRLLLPSIFGKGQTLVAFAQAEAFNWMEYNDSYGGYATEKFDEVSSNVFGSLLACPRAWRLSTVGGWNWQPRLSVSDAISKINTDGDANEEGVTFGNPEFKDFLSQAQLTNTDNLISIH